MPSVHSPVELLPGVSTILIHRVCLTRVSNWTGRNPGMSGVRTHRGGSYDLGVPKPSHDEGGLVCLTQRCIPSVRLWFWSAVDDGHVPFVVAFAGGGVRLLSRSICSALSSMRVGGGVLLDAGDPLGARDRGDVVALGE